jgi:L-lactate dehydrogenase complex protein LldG
MSVSTAAGAADRALILGRIHNALLDVPGDEQPEDVEVPRAYHVVSDEGGGEGADAAPSDLVALFAERAADYRAAVVRTGLSDLPAVIARLLGERAVKRLVAPRSLPDEFLSLANGIEILRDEPQLSVADLDACDAVVTGAALAMAATGTIVLDGGPGQGRRAVTLLPDYHLCVVRTDQIVADLTVAVRRLDPTRPLTLISGPSATSDVENTRVEGVHGPRTLDIVLVEADRGGNQA